MFKLLVLLCASMAISEASLIPSSLNDGSYTEISSGVPQPYNFGYDVVDNFGTTLKRRESSDGNGAVTGSYGYTDKQGLYRTVDYVADALGFRAQVKTNEPGTEKSEPASAPYDASPIVISSAVTPLAIPALPSPSYAWGTIGSRRR